MKHFKSFSNAINLLGGALILTAGIMAAVWIVWATITFIIGEI